MKKLINKKKEKKKNKNVVNKINTADFIKLFDGDIDLCLFYVTWLKNGQIAKLAYKELHPHVTDGSAEVLGSKWLSRIKLDMLMPRYGLDIHIYLTQLRDGLEAMRKRAEIVDRDDKGRPIYEYFDEPDHSTRKDYHDKLGKLIGVESDKTNFAVQVNNYSPDQLKDEQLNAIIS